MEEFKKYLNYDPATGNFSWKHNTFIAGTFRNDGYIQLCVRRNLELAHRVAWYFVHNEVPKIIDHVNGKRADNRIANLCNVTMHENGFNRHNMNSNNSSGIDGVSYHKPRNKWRARFIVNGKLHHVGTFSTKEKAADAL